MIVVGGGHNGLTAAAYLARAGQRVCVLERRDVLGGACVTEEVWPGHRISRASYVVSLLHPKVVADLRLKAFGYEVHPLDPAYSTLPPDGPPLFFFNDEQKTVRLGFARPFAARRRGVPGRSRRCWSGWRTSCARCCCGRRRRSARVHPGDLLGVLREAGRAAGLTRAGRPRLLPRDDDVGRRPAGRLVRARRVQGRDGVDRRRRRVGRTTDAGHRLQPAPSRARRARRRAGPLGARAAAAWGRSRRRSRAVPRRPAPSCGSAPTCTRST